MSPTITKDTIEVDKQQWEQQQLLMELLQHEMERVNGNMYEANSATDLISQLHED